MKKGLTLAAGMAVAILFTAGMCLAQMECGMMGAGGHGGHSKEETPEAHGKAASMDCPMMGGACERWMGSPTFYLDRVEDLGLSAEQVASLRAIRLAYEKDAAVRQAEVRTAELEVEDALSRGQVDIDLVDGRLQKAVKAWTAWRLRRILTGKQVLDVLTPEQRAKAGASGDPAAPSPRKEGPEGHKGHGGHMMRYGILGGVAMATVMAVEHVILRR